MTTLPSIRALIVRFMFLALLLTQTGCVGGNPAFLGFPTSREGLDHVRKGLTTDPSWKETQLPQPKQVDAPEPVAEPEKSQ